jgi:hypothetical protein
MGVFFILKRRCEIFRFGSDLAFGFGFGFGLEKGHVDSIK